MGNEFLRTLKVPLFSLLPLPPPPLGSGVPHNWAFMKAAGEAKGSTFFLSCSRLLSLSLFSSPYPPSSFLPLPPTINEAEDSFSAASSLPSMPPPPPRLFRSSHLFCLITSGAKKQIPPPPLFRLWKKFRLFSFFFFSPTSSKEMEIKYY